MFPLAYILNPISEGNPAAFMDPFSVACVDIIERWQGILSA